MKILKVLFAVALLSFFASCQKADTDAVHNSSAAGSSSSIASDSGLPPELQDSEDCDEKAAKPVEVVEVNLSGGGDAGCTLE